MDSIPAASSSVGTGVPAAMWPTSQVLRSDRAENHTGGVVLCCAIASEDCSPIPDGRGPVDYKRHLAGVLTKRALRKAAGRALA